MKSTKWLSVLAVLLLTVFVACKDKDNNKAAEIGITDDVTAKNIEITKNFYTLFEKSDWAGIEKIVAPGFTDHSPMMPPGAAFNRDTLMKYVKSTKEGFPDMKYEILHTAGTGDMVFVHYRFTGTNSGPFMDMPATNKKIDYSGVDLLKIKDGQAIEHWDYADNITFMKQMGMMPEQ